MKPVLALPALALLTACATTPPPGTNAQVAPAGSLVALRQPVAVGELVLTPMQVTQDSRCAENARCSVPGKLVVETRIDGPGWHETVPLILGERHVARGVEIALVSGLPERTAGSETPGEAYRFAFEQVRQLAVAQVGERVPVDGPAVTPLEVLEDSRCPAGVQCVRAGPLRLRVKVHLGAGDQTRDLLLREPVQVADGTLELVEAWPQPTAGGAIAPADYRFTFRFDGGL